MAVVWRVIVVLAVFIVVAFAASHVVMQHELLTKVGAPFAEVRLVSWMAGLFAGGVGAVVAGIAVLIKRGH
jgi:hypothetical protein